MMQYHFISNVTKVSNSYHKKDAWHREIIITIIITLIVIIMLSGTTTKSPSLLPLPNHSLTKQFKLGKITITIMAT